MESHGLLPGSQSSPTRMPATSQIWNVTKPLPLWMGFWMNGLSLKAKGILIPRSLGLWPCRDVRVGVCIQDGDCAIVTTLAHLWLSSAEPKQHSLSWSQTLHKPTHHSQMRTLHALGTGVICRWSGWDWLLHSQSSPVPRQDYYLVWFPRYRAWL